MKRPHRLASFGLDVLLQLALLLALDALVAQLFWDGQGLRAHWGNERFWVWAALIILLPTGGRALGGWPFASQRLVAWWCQRQQRG